MGSSRFNSILFSAVSPPGPGGRVDQIMDYYAQKNEKCENNLRLVDLEIYRLKMEIVKKEEGIGTAVSKIKSIEMDIQQKVMLQDKLSKMKLLNETRLATYHQIHQKMIISTPEYQEIEKLKLEISNKENAIEQIGKRHEGTPSKNSRNEIALCHLNEEKIETESTINEIIEKINVRKAKEAKLKLDISVLNKRNAAQQLRLRHSIKEAQLRKNHWHFQVESVKHKIEQIRKQDIP